MAESTFHCCLAQVEVNRGISGEKCKNIFVTFDTNAFPQTHVKQEYYIKVPCVNRKMQINGACKVSIPYFSYKLCGKHPILKISHIMLPF